MARLLSILVLTVMIIAPSVAGAFPQVPERTAPNPPGLARPSHLGAEWPYLNIDEKLYSLRFASMRQDYEQWSKAHMHARTSTYPGLEEQFNITAYKILPPDYYGRNPQIDYHQPFTEWSANISGQTGLITMPSAFTQKKGVMQASIGFTSSSAERSYFRALYDSFDCTDMRISATYGYRDDTEFTLNISMLDRDMHLADGSHPNDSNLFIGIGGKMGFGTKNDRYQMAVGWMYSFISSGDRQYLRPIDYHTMSHAYIVGSTDTRLFNAHFMYKWVAYDWKSDEIETIGSSGYGPEDDHWAEMGLGFEYKLPEKNLTFITEITGAGQLHFATRKDRFVNFGVLGKFPGADVKIYTRMPNHDSFSEYGLISTFHF